MFLLLFALWIIFNGKLTLELVLLGIVISCAVTVFSYKVLGWNIRTAALIARNLPLIIFYILRLLFEIVKSAFAVQRMVYRADEPDPVIVEFHSGFNSNIQNVLLANSITLTPGTITLFQEGDHFVIHCLRREFAEGIEDSVFTRLLSGFKF